MKAVGADSAGGGGLFGLLKTVGIAALGLLGKPAGLGPQFTGVGTAALAEQGSFAHGGSFMVGGSGATDSQLVSFLASPGERVDVLTPAQQGAGAAPTVNMTQNFDFKGASLEAVALLRRKANRIKQEVMAEIISSARRGGAFARMSRI